MNLGGVVAVVKPSARSIVIGMAVLLALIANISCGSALRIRRRPVATPTAALVSVPGVPFYPKKARCRQEIVWFEPIYTLELKAVIPDKDGALQTHPRGAVMLSRSNFESDDVKSLMKLLNNGPADEGTVLAAWRKVVTHVEQNVMSRQFANIDKKDLILVGRSSAPAVFVDYSDQYFVNARVPFAGSANVDAKIAEDGSLSEASGQVEDKTFETIVGALPISSVITGELGIPGGKSIADTGQVEGYQLSITISGYQHTLGRLIAYPLDQPAANQVVICPTADDIPLASNTEYKREDISDKASNKSDGGDTTAKKDSTNDSGGKPGKQKK